MIAPTLPSYAVPASGLDSLEADLLRNSFYEFVREMWSEVSPETFHGNWHIEYLCDVLQTQAMRVFQGLPKEQDLIINQPPGTTKSIVASVMFAPWTWTWMPSAKHLLATHTQDLGLDLSRKARDVVRSAKYRRLFPHITLRGDQDTKSYWINEQGGFRLSCTVGGKNPMGFHAHFLTVDDPLDPQKAVSDLELKAANAFMAETLPTRKVDKMVSVTTLIMQRLHQNDPTGNWLNRGGNKPKHVCLPAELSEFVSPPELAERYVDGLLDPRRLPVSALENAKAELGEYGYSGQFRQHPVPLGGGMFKVDRIKLDVAPESLQMVVRYWDKAATPEGGAFTVGVKMGRERVSDGFRYWILDVVRGQWSSEDREQRIRNTAESDGRGVIVGIEQEPGSGGKESAESTVRRLAGFRVRVDKPTGDKTLRADPFSVQVNSGNVRMTGGPWNAAFINELEYFPFSTYKDQVDATSGAFNMLVKAPVRVGAF